MKKTIIKFTGYIYKGPHDGGFVNFEGESEFSYKQVIETMKKLKIEGHDYTIEDFDIKTRKCILVW